LLALLPALARQGVGSFTAWITFLSIGYGAYLFGGTTLGDPNWPDWLWPILTGLGGGLAAGMITQWRRAPVPSTVPSIAWAGCGAAVGAGGAAIGGGLGLGMGWPFVYQADVPGILYVLAVALVALLLSLAFISTFILRPSPRPQASMAALR
jgi:H+/Cl- antiporter ClcA